MVVFVIVVAINDAISHVTLLRKKENQYTHHVFLINIQHMPFSEQLICFEFSIDLKLSSNLIDVTVD